MKVQVRITLPLELRQEIDQLRMVWNPERAIGNPAHITAIYHDEAPDPALLIERVREAAVRMSRFQLTIGQASRFELPVRGAFLPVVDPSRGIAQLRDLVLASPFTRRERYGLHVTLLHPDQGEQLEEAWPAFEALSPRITFVVTEIEVVGADNLRLEVFQLK